MRLRVIFVAIGLSLIPPAVFAADEVLLDRDGVVELLSEKTVLCRKEKDQSLCTNYFSEGGVIKQVMHDEDDRKEGVWFVDDQDRLCILWTGKIKPLCFAVYAQPDGSQRLIKNDRHLTTILGTEDGNTKGL